MSFVAKLQRAREVLEQQQRLSARALAREIGSSAEEFEELIEELVDIQQVVRREGAALVWINASSTPVPAPATRPPAPDPRDYTPRHLADKILQSKSALEGERKQVTVLFADVKGSMALAEQLDPEEWHRILERFFEILTAGVHRFEGTVNQYTGDGVMALFGAPIAHEDHAQRACYAALHLIDALRGYAREVRRVHGVDFAFRMGINCGDVVVGRIGDDLRMDYTAQGHTVGLAQRMESLAEPNSCVLSEAAAALVGSYFALEDLGEFQVKGVASALRVHCLVGAGAAQTRFDVSRARGLSRFVGRATDMRVLEDTIAQATAGNGQVIGVVAEAGTGKSRLCFEFLERCRAQGMRVYEGRAVAHGKNVPLLPILEVFRTYFGITVADDDRSAREKIAGRMVLLDQSLAESLPLVFDFLGVADPTHPPLRLDAEVRQRQLLALMRQVTQSEARPMVTLIEDLHWLDSASGEFIEHMVDMQAGSRNLLLLNFRPEYHAKWMQKSWYRQIPLTPLGPEAIAELLADRLGTDISLAGFSDAVHARTAGNPFFAEEVVQALIESGQIEGTRGAYRLVDRLDRLEVPATVQAVLASRIDRLPEREKRLLQTAAVIGKDFVEPLLAAVAELSADALKASLAALRRAEFVYEQTIYPVTEYAFKHPLTQEVALGSQLKDRRRLVHAAVARAIEQQHAESLDERAALIAHHWEEADHALDAARWHRRAAEWAGQTDFAAGTRHWERVRELLRAVPGDQETALLGIVACTELLFHSWQIGGDGERARGLLTEGRAYAHAIDDQRADVILSMTYARALLSNGNVKDALASAFENYTAARALSDLPVQAYTCAFLIDALGYAGRYPEALALSDEALARFPLHLPLEDWVYPFSPLSLFLIWRGICLSWMGRIAEGTEAIDRCLHVTTSERSPLITSYAAWHGAECCRLAGDAERALAYARQAQASSLAIGEPSSLVAVVQAAFAYAHLTGERAVEAIETARSSLALLERVEKQRVGGPAALLSEALLLAGDLSAAESAARQAIDLCRSTLSGANEAIAHGVLARTLLRRDGQAACTAAESALASSAMLIERTAAATLAPALLEWRAELAGVRGDHPTRCKLLQQASQGYRAIGAPLQSERVARVLAA